MPEQLIVELKHPHGDYRTYLRPGCKCLECKAGWAAYQKGLRSRKKAKREAELRAKVAQRAALII